MKKVTVFILTAILISVSASAQHFGHRPFSFEIDFAVGTPQGTFMQELERNSYGLDMSFTYQVPDSPVHIGMGLTYQNFGWRERYTNIYGIPEVDLKVRTTNNMVTPHLIMRIESPTQGFRPFVEGTLGFNYLFTESSLLDDWDDEEIASDINHDYLTSSFGLGGGVKIDLYEGLDDDGDFFGVSMVVRSRLNLGGEALYMKEGDLERTSDGVILNLRRSRTDLTTFNVGFVLSF